jgi:hypothetical protein
LADFMAVTACSNPRIKDHEAVEALIQKYYFDPDFQVGVGFDEEDGSPYLFAYGYVWPEAWPLPEYSSRPTFDPYAGDTYEEGDDGFLQFMKDVARHLLEPLTLQAIGNTKCRFPLSACQWTIRPGSRRVHIIKFREVAKAAMV